MENLNNNQRSRSIGSITKAKITGGKVRKGLTARSCAVTCLCTAIFHKGFGVTSRPNDSLKPNIKLNSDIATLPGDSVDGGDI